MKPTWSGAGLALGGSSKLEVDQEATPHQLTTLASGLMGETGPVWSGGTT